MSDTKENAVGESRNALREEMGCLDITPDIFIGESDPCVDDIEVTPDIQVNDTTSPVNEEMNKNNMFDSGEKLFVPDGLEIIPIFKKRRLSDHVTQSLCSRVDDNSPTEYHVSNSDFEVGENTDFQNRIHTPTQQLCKSREFSEDCDPSEMKLPDNFVYNEESANFPQMAMSGSMDVNTFLNHHFLLSSYGLEDKEVRFQTNLEMLIGRKSENLHYCKLCGVESESKSAISDHINSTHSSRKDFELSIKCPLCPYKNINKFKLNSHITSHTEEKPFRCPVCDYGTNTKSMMKKHMFTHSEDKPFKCNDCPYTSNEKYKVRVHSLNQHSSGLKPFQCELCSYSSADKSTLKRHSIIHSEVKPFNCDTCPYSGNSIHDLRKHESAHTNIKPFSWNFCDYTCNFNSNLQKHIKTHTGEKKYKCSDCSFATLSRSKLIKHGLKHTGQLPFRCTECTYATAEHFYFKQHMNSHNNVRDFKCKLCDYAGTSNNNLKRHMLKHSEEKPFKCGECDYATKESGKLKRHSRTHNKPLPKECPYCDFKDFNNYNYKRHLLNHSKGPGYRCTVCYSVCESKAELTVHLKSHPEECDDNDAEYSDNGNSTEDNESYKASEQGALT